MNFGIWLALLSLLFIWNQNFYCAAISTKDYLNVVILYYRFRSVQIITHLGCFTNCEYFFLYRDSGLFRINPSFVFFMQPRIWKLRLDCHLSIFNFDLFLILKIPGA